MTQGILENEVLLGVGNLFSGKSVNVPPKTLQILLKAFMKTGTIIYT